MSSYCNSGQKWVKMWSDRALTRVLLQIYCWVGQWKFRLNIWRNYRQQYYIFDSHWPCDADFGPRCRTLAVHWCGDSVMLRTRPGYAIRTLSRLQRRRLAKSLPVAYLPEWRSESDKAHSRDVWLQGGGVLSYFVDHSCSVRLTFETIVAMFRQG